MTTRKSIAQWSFLGLLLFIPWIGSAKTAKEMVLSWGEKPGALKYEVQLGKNAELTPLLYNLTTRLAQVTVRLDEGTYFFRLRWFNQANKPAPWSGVNGFVVNAAPPRPLFPKSGQTFRRRLPLDGISLQWTKGVTGSNYVIEIRDQYGPVLTRNADQATVQWSPTTAGLYRWRIGFETIFNTEWSPYQEFTVEESALPSKKIQVIKVERPVRLLSFELKVFGIFQPGGSLYTGELSWNPEISISQNIYLRPYIGLSPLAQKEDPADPATANKNLMMLDYGIDLDYQNENLRPFAFGVRAGAQTWTTIGTYPAAGLQIEWMSKAGSSSLLDRVFVEYQGVGVSSAFAHMIKLGVGLSFSK